MEKIIQNFVLYLSGPVAIILFIFFFLIKYADKVDIWLGHFYRLSSYLFTRLKKQSIKYDIQGHLNEFVRESKKVLTGIEYDKIKIELLGRVNGKDAIIQDDKIVIRLKDNDPNESNYAKAAFLFISKSFLFKAKKYVSRSVLKKHLISG